MSALLGADNALNADADAPFRFREELHVVGQLSSASDALALGHRDLVAVLKPNPDRRDNTRIQCKYFGKCSGCQHQMLKTARVKACRNFTGKTSSRVIALLTRH